MPCCIVSLIAQSQTVAHVVVSSKSPFHYSLKVGKFFRTFFSCRQAQLFFFIVIKIARISRTFAFRFKRRLELNKNHKLRFNTYPQQKIVKPQLDYLIIGN